jgi:hypothetical protein
VTTRTATIEGRSKEEAKYLASIYRYLQKITQVRSDMTESKREIARLKAASRRKLAEIDAILSRVEAAA